jgi:opacity protein-like surface antigen/outer membrane receptor protein involved in Fe transport
MFRSVRNELLLGSSVVALFAVVGTASAQQVGQALPPSAGQPSPTVVPPSATPIPQINVTAPRRTAARPAQRPAGPPAAPTPPPTPEQVQMQANQEVIRQNQTFDQRRDDVIMTKAGTSNYQLNAGDIQQIPQANAIQLSDLILQFPGAYQDSTSQGDFHLRNEHANVQYRINGVLLPDGVSGFSQIIESSFIDSMRLITGALPAQFGLHTTGIIDITSKSGTALAGGSVSLYGGSRQTISPSFEYGGVEGNTEYYATGRYLSTGLGLENPTGSLNAIHDYSQQGRLFTYTSTLLDPTSRLVTIAGFGETEYQIPNNPGQPGNVKGFGGACVAPNGTTFPSAFGSCSFNSANLNQRQYEKNAYGVVAWQKSEGNLDMQLSYYNRYSDLHFVPDPVGDLFINNVASDVFRSTFLNGISGDFAYRLNDAHTLRAGFFTQGEQTQIRSINTVQPVDSSGFATDTPFNVTDASNLFGWQLGAYVQDEWRLTDQLTFNYGVRFDQSLSYVDTNQFSPRASLTYKPWWSTVFHAGYMRTFTPPPQSEARAVDPTIFDGTTAQSAVRSTPILPERAHVVDAGVVQQLLPQCPTVAAGPTKAPVAASSCPSLEVGVDAYYKASQDLIDDGQFGQALILTAFNYARAENYGGEFTARFRYGNFAFDGNWAYGLQRATQVASNQALFDQAALDFIATHWIHTDHDQYMTGSGRASYRWTDTHSWLDGTTASATFIYGTGLRQDGVFEGGPCPNCGHVPAYYQVNLGLSHEFANGWNGLPYTVRFDVVNVTDNIYEIRSGTGVGIFAPQFGPRRGYFMGITQKLGAPEKAPDVSPGYYTKAAAATAYRWNGLYAGANFGGALSAGEGVATSIGGDTTNPSGVLGGLQLGYNYKFAPTWLAGIEGEFDWTSAQGKANFIDPSASLSVISDHNWYGTLSGRLGYVMGPLMLYGKAGAAWMNADYRMEANSGIDGFTLTNTTRTGWNIGAGLEYMLGSRWSAKLEYDYLDFGSNTLSFVNPFGNSVTFKTAVNEVKAGVNYHFDGMLPF